MLAAISILIAGVFLLTVTLGLGWLIYKADPDSVSCKKLTWLLTGQPWVYFKPHTLRKGLEWGNPYEKALTASYGVRSFINERGNMMMMHSFWGFQVSREYSMTEVDYKWIQAYLAGVPLQANQRKLVRYKHVVGPMVQRKMPEAAPLGIENKPLGDHLLGYKATEPVKTEEEVVVAEEVAISDEVQDLAKLIAALKFLVSNDVPSVVTDPRTGQLTDHWSMTKRAMEAHLKRSLTGPEVCCLSLSRNFGPLAGLQPQTQEFLQDLLWKGQSRGFYTWEFLRDTLEGVLAEA